MTGTPAGWYADPERPGQQRYWDGLAWTEHRAPGAGPADTPPPGTPPGYYTNPQGESRYWNGYTWTQPPSSTGRNTVVVVVVAAVIVLFVLPIIAVIAIQIIGSEANTAFQSVGNSLSSANSDRSHGSPLKASLPPIGVAAVIVGGIAADAVATITRKRRARRTT